MTYSEQNYQYRAELWEGVKAQHPQGPQIIELIGRPEVFGCLLGRFNKYGQDYLQPVTLHHRTKFFLHFPCM